MDKKEVNIEDKILEVAIEVFTDKGIDGARMQEIADKAEINKSLLHYYYRSKEKLFEVSFQKTIDNVMVNFGKILDPKADIETNIKMLFINHVQFIQDNPKLPVFVANTAQRRPDLLKKAISNINLSVPFINLIANFNNDKNYKNLSESDMINFAISFVSLSIFPVMMAPIVEALFNKNSLDYNNIIENRKTDIPIMLMNSIKEK